MKTYSKYITEANALRIDPRKYKQVWYGPDDDGSEYANDLVDEFKKLVKDIKKVAGLTSGPESKNLYSIAKAIENII